MVLWWFLYTAGFRTFQDLSWFCTCHCCSIVHTTFPVDIKCSKLEAAFHWHGTCDTRSVCNHESFLKVDQLTKSVDVISSVHINRFWGSSGTKFSQSGIFPGTSISTNMSDVIHHPDLYLSARFITCMVDIRWRSSGDSVKDSSRGEETAVKNETKYRCSISLGHSDKIVHGDILVPVWFADLCGTSQTILPSLREGKICSLWFYSSCC